LHNTKYSNFSPFVVITLVVDGPVNLQISTITLVG